MTQYTQTYIKYRHHLNLCLICSFSCIFFGRYFMCVEEKILFFLYNFFFLVFHFFSFPFF